MNPLVLNNDIPFQHPIQLLLIPLLLLALLAFQLQLDQDELVRWKRRAHVAEARVLDLEQLEEQEQGEQGEEDDVMVIRSHRAKRKAVDELVQEWRKIQEWRFGRYPPKGKRASSVYSGGLKLHPGRAFLSTTNNLSKMGLIVFPMKYFICGIQLTPDDASFQFSRYSEQIARLAKMNNWVDLPEQNISNSPFLSLRAGHDLSRYLMDKEGSMEHI